MKAFRIFTIVTALFFSCSLLSQKNNDYTRYRNYDEIIPKDSVVYNNRKILLSCRVDSLIVFINNDNLKSGIHSDINCPSLRTGIVNSRYLKDLDKGHIICPHCQNKYPFMNAAIDSVYKRRNLHSSINKIASHL